MGICAAVSYVDGSMGSFNIKTSVRYEHNQDPAVFHVIKINYDDKNSKGKRRARWFSRYFGQSSRPFSGDVMKIWIVVTTFI